MSERTKRRPNLCKLRTKKPKNVSGTHVIEIVVVATAFPTRETRTWENKNANSTHTRADQKSNSKRVIVPSEFRNESNIYIYMIYDRDGMKEKLKKQNFKTPEKNATCRQRNTRRPYRRRLRVGLVSTAFCLRPVERVPRTQSSALRSRGWGKWVVTVIHGSVATAGGVDRCVVVVVAIGPCRCVRARMFRNPTVRPTLATPVRRRDALVVDGHGMG